MSRDLPLQHGEKREICNAIDVSRNPRKIKSDFRKLGNLPAYQLYGLALPGRCFVKQFTA